MTDKSDSPLIDTETKSLEYLKGVNDQLQKRIEQIAELESKATKYLSGIVGMIVAGLAVAVGLSYYSKSEIDAVVRNTNEIAREIEKRTAAVTQEAKNEIREIIGRARPDDMLFGRIEPGDDETLVFYLNIIESDDNDTFKLLLRTSPFLEAKGQQAIFYGWRFRLKGQLLDWFTSRNEFDNSVSETDNQKYRELQLSLSAFGQIVPHTFESKPAPLTVLPGVPYDTDFQMGVSYETCELAKKAAVLLFDESEENKGVEKIFLTPLVANFSLKPSSFKAEIVLPGSLETACHPPEEGPIAPE